MALTLNNLSLVVKGDLYLDDLNVSFDRGSFNVLLGRTLAGKTSLLRVIAGLDRPTTGRLLMDGEDVTGVPVQQRRISMVYQQFINYPNLSVFENIASPLRIAGARNIKSKVEEVAALLHIEEFLPRFPLQLSGGQQQRTAMARALVKNSDLILFDEPLVNLDYKLREELRTELRELFKQRNTIAIYASSDPAEALALGGMTTVLHKGRIIQSGPVNEVYSQPQGIEAAELFSEPPINVLNGTLNQKMVTLRNGCRFKFEQAGQMHSGEYFFGLRPHHLKTVADSDDLVELELKVDVAEISGSETYLHLSDGPMILVAHLGGVHNFHTDTPLRMYFSPSQLYVFDRQGKTVQLPTDCLSLRNNT